MAATLLPYIFALIYCTHLAFVHGSTSTPHDEGEEVFYFIFYFFSTLYIHVSVKLLKHEYKIIYVKFNPSDLFN
jgi:hypothetical protein